MGQRQPKVTVFSLQIQFLHKTIEAYEHAEDSYMTEEWQTSLVTVKKNPKIAHRHVNTSEDLRLLFACDELHGNKQLCEVTPNHTVNTAAST